MSEQTVGALSVVTGISRSTLLQAAQQGRLPARQSGNIWLIDAESEKYKQWLEDRPKQARVKGKKRDEQKHD
jgi:excisionase family DNA binding protein